MMSPSQVRVPMNERRPVVRPMYLAPASRAMRHRVRLLVLLGVFAQLAACGDSDNGSSTDATCTPGADGCPCSEAAPCDPGADAGPASDLGATVDVAPGLDGGGLSGPSCEGGPPLEAFCPCRDDEDCGSSVCLPARDDAATALCSRTCFDACPEGWSCTPVQLPGTDPVFMCVQMHLNLCRPCTTDAQCQTGPAPSTADRCVVHGDTAGSFCGTACEVDADCPGGFACREARALENGATVRQCLPADPGASCECSARAVSEGAWTRCSYGDCQGTRTCSPDGLSACLDPDGGACQLDSAVRVRFDAQGGTPVLPDTRELPLGQPYGALPETTRAGHDFLGWWTETGGQGSRVFESTLVARSEPHVLYAAWSGTSALVTFEPAGGSVPIPSAKQVTFGGTYGGLPTSDREGYAFDGWWTTPEGAGERVTPTSLVAIEGPHTLWARWRPGTFTVSFDPRGGSAVNPATVTVTFGSAYGELPTSQRPGFAFAGWNTSADGTGAAVTAATEVATPRNHTLFATWKALAIAVAFDAGDGETPVPTTKNVTFAEAYGPLAVTFRRGHVFDGWYTEAGGQGSLVEPMTRVTNPAPHTLHAGWTVARYRVTFDPDGGSQPIPGAREVTWGTAYGPLPTTAREGYTFAGWHTGRDGAGTPVEPTTTVDIAEAHTLYARWTPNTYAVTFDAGEGEAATPPGKTVTFGAAYGALATTARIGYRFDGWATAPDGAGVLVTDATPVTRAADHTLHARWTAEQITVRFDSAGGAEPEPPTRVVTYDAPYGPLATTTRPGYDFGGWFKAPGGPAGGGDAVTSATPVEDPSSHTLYAHWIAKQLAVTFLPASGAPPTPGTKLVTFDSPYGALATTSRPGYTLAGWWTEADGGSEVTPESRVTNPEPHALHARWTANQYTVTFSSAGTPPAPGSKRVTFATPYGPLATTARDGYVFTGWWTAPAGGLEVRPESVVETAGPHTLHAQWRGATYTVTFDPDGGTAVDPTTQAVVFASPYPVADFPLTGRVGYTFSGWFTGRNGAGTRVEAGTVVAIARDHVLYAAWVPRAYTVTFDPGLGTPPVPDSRAVTFDAPYGALATTSRLGYRFTGWWTEDAGGVEITTGTVVTTARDHVLHARWEPVSMTVTFNAGLGTPASPPSKAVTFDALYGALATTTRSGFLFRGWWTGSGGTGTEVTAVTTVFATADHALHARWESACSSPCLNGGFCSGVNQCTCVNGYTGATCSVAPVPPPGFVFVPPGPFNMGSPLTEAGRDADENQVGVTLTRGFFIGQREVTLGQWKARAGKAPNGIAGDTQNSDYIANCGDTCPVIEVSWWSVLGYANALSQAEGLPPCYTMPTTLPGGGSACTGDWQGGRLDCGDQLPVIATGTVYACSGYRLPTEAEWEFAARAGTTTATPLGNVTNTCLTQASLDPIAWWAATRREFGAQITYPSVVGAKAATGSGLFDMFGNVAEWVWDRYAGPADSIARFVLPGGEDPQLFREGAKRGLRGGSYESCTPALRAAARDARSYSDTLPWLGFRLVRTAGP